MEFTIVIVHCYFFVVQPLIYYSIKTRLSTWKLARFVWLAASGAGGFNESKGKLPLDLINKHTRRQMLLDVRTIHNLWRSVKNLTAEKDDINQRIAEIDRQISANSKIISYNNSAKESRDATRIIEDKKIENESLTEEKVGLQQSLENKSLDLEKYQNLLNVIETDTANTIIGMWKKMFSTAEFSQDFILDLIRKFSLEDFRLVEKRIFEVCNTTSPKSLAKRISLGYSLSFLTNHMDLATLIFSLDNSSAPTFIKIDRAVSLQETPLSREELQQVISLYEKSGSDKSKDLLAEYEIQMTDLQQQQNTWEIERKELKDQSNALENQKEKLLSDIKFNYDKIDDLQNQIVSKEKDCDLLHKLLEKTPKSELLSISHADQTEELSKLEHKYEVKIADNNKLLEDLEYVNKQKEALQQEYDKQEKEIFEHEQINIEFKNDLENQKQEIKQKELDIKQKDQDIYLKSRLLDKMKTKKIKEKEIAQNLKKDIALLKKEKKELEETIQVQRKNIDIIEEDLKKFENFFHEEKEKVVKLKNESEGITAKLLTNQGIYDELYNQIEAARKYIYIVAPFMNDQQFNNLLNNLDAAKSRHPDLKVKLLYGVKVRPGNDQEANLNDSEDEYTKASKLELRLGKNAMTKRGNTYARAIIFDDKSFILGSTNVISLGGNDNEALQDNVAIDEVVNVETAHDDAATHEAVNDDFVQDDTVMHEAMNDDLAQNDTISDDVVRNETALFSTDVRICQQLKRQYFDW
ncbi:hypothetical protein Q5O14_09000 [Eubacteriaceae bacterium ES2]|nr:hypothetical protein Q5O14_09000 [Eubacteriaceae bacterium ES2]